MYKIYQITYEIKIPDWAETILKTGYFATSQFKITATTTLQIDIRFEPELYLAKIKPRTRLFH